MLCHGGCVSFDQSEAARDAEAQWQGCRRACWTQRALGHTCASRFIKMRARLSSNKRCSLSATEITGIGSVTG